MGFKKLNEIIGQRRGPFFKTISISKGSPKFLDDLDLNPEYFVQADPGNNKTYC